jgi:MFS-type transporter involved in bile tolerance (Atg22 family)
VNVFEAFALVAVTGLAASVAIALLLRPHLAPLLGELCGSAARARFWLAVCLLWMVLVTVLASTATFGYPDSDTATGSQVFFGALTQVRALLAGLLGSVLGVALAVLSFVRRFDANAAPPRTMWRQPTQGGAAGPAAR